MRGDFDDDDNDNDDLLSTNVHEYIILTENADEHRN